jgi:hypothetical protein
MFYTRINKMKVFDNREGFPELFNRSAEMRIYSYVSNPAGTTGHYLEGRRPVAVWRNNCRWRSGQPTASEIVCQQRRPCGLLAGLSQPFGRQQSII